MNGQPLKTPVAFLIFNRPEVTFRVFEKIAAQRPETLLVVADGPRNPAESELCEKARSILSKIDWNCNVLTNLSETNLGCKRRVSSGIDWVFQNVEEAIILEDDCLPSDSFFSYCETMLARYRDDERVMAITGSNVQDGVRRTEYSYYFSKLMMVWGWASWRRAWNHYDVDMMTWPEFKNSGLLQAYIDGHDEEQHWLRVFDTAYEKRIDTWDFQWLYACWAHSGFTITPDRNLISNLGFGADATHTTSPDSPLNSRSTEDLWEISHPPTISRHAVADLYAVRTYYMPPCVQEEQPAPPAESHASAESVTSMFKRIVKSSIAFASRQ